MRSSYRHPFLRLGALTGALAVACHDLHQIRPLQSTRSPEEVVPAVYRVDAIGLSNLICGCWPSYDGQ